MELVISLPLWLILIQFIGVFANSKEFTPTFSLKKYLAASHKIEGVDILSFNSFFVILFATIFFQSLTSYYILINEVRFSLPYYFFMILSTVFVGIYRFRLTLIRREAVEIVQLVLSQVIIISIIVLTWFLLQTDSFLLRVLFIVPLSMLFYSTELQFVKAGTIYSDMKYLEIMSSYIRLLYQGGFILFLLSLIYVGSDLSALIMSKFEVGYFHFAVTTILLLLSQLFIIVLSNIYYKFQPLKDYQSLLKSSKYRVVISFIIFIILCGSKALNVF